MTYKTRPITEAGAQLTYNNDAIILYALDGKRYSIPIPNMKDSWRTHKYWIYIVYTMYNSVDLKVRKWGNSLGIRLPKHLAALMNVEDGTDIQMIFKSDHVELRLQQDVTPASTEEEAVVTHPTVSAEPSYQPGLRSRRNYLTLTDENFEDSIGKYPFVIVLYLDYMYLDFYDRIQQRLVLLKELSDYYRGLVWFALAQIEDNDLAREKYIGNVWSEEEIRAFINGELAFKAAKLEDIGDAIESFLPQEKRQVLNKRKRIGSPILATPANMSGILSRNRYVVSGFFPPGDQSGIRVLNELSRKYRGKVAFTITIDRVLFNEKSRTFYRNPLIERFAIVENSEIIIFRGGAIAKRGDFTNKEELTGTIDEVINHDTGKRSSKVRKSGK